MVEKTDGKMILRKNESVKVLIFLFAFSSVSMVFANPLDNWHFRNPLSQENSLYAVTYGINKFVAVGKAGTILISGDGISWNAVNSGTSEDLYGIAYGNGIFVASGSAGKILISADGIAWMSGHSGTDDWLPAITYGNNTFAAVGRNGTILTSIDGINWIIRDSGVTIGIYDITYGNKLFIAVGSSGLIRTSADGIVWNGSSGTSDYLSGIAYGNNIFAAVGSGGTILTSIDGYSWTRRTSEISKYIYGITYKNNTFVAVGTDGTILKSADGVNWTSGSSGFSGLLFGITYGNYTFVAVGDNGTILQSDSLTCPLISIPSDTIDFNNVDLGKSLFKSITVTNSGYSDLDIADVVIIGENANEFTIQKDYSGQSLAVSETRTIEVGFLPKTLGSKIANLSIPSNDPYNSTLIVPLKGYGLILQLGNIDITSPGSVDRIDGHDLYVLSMAFGSKPGDPNWNPAADLNDDLVIDGMDLVLLARNYGKSSF